MTLWRKWGSFSLVGMFFFFVEPLTGVSQTNVETTQEPMEYVIENIQGSNVQVLEEGQNLWEPAQEGQVLEAGDEIKVGDKSQADLMLQSETSIHLSEQTDLKVDEISANQDGGFFSRMKVLTGIILADVKKNLQASHSSFEVESNGVICGVRGTAFEVRAQGSDTAQISTYEGKVEVSNGGESHMVPAGNFSSFSHGKLRSQRLLDRLEIQRFQRWRVFRQVLMKKRIQRLADIRSHRRQLWHRLHPYPRDRRFKRDKKLLPKNHPFRS